MYISNSKINSSLLFLRSAIKDFKVRGALLPSSNALGKRMVAPIKMKKGIVIVELGAGTGSFTKVILSKLPKDGKLLAFEIEPNLARYLRDRFKDERVVIISDDAAKMHTHLRKYGVEKADHIISGIPLGSFDRNTRQRILEAVYNNLKDDGLYMQFQYLLASILHIKKIFNVKISAYEIRNMPPAFVYQCKKKKIRASAN